MKWRCVLFQRWLPDYPDGELSPFWRRHLEAHLPGCPDCREEWAGLQEAVKEFRRHPLPAQEPAFWEAFNRELHQKLVQVNYQTPVPEPRRFKLPYMLGAPALVVLLIYLSSYLVNLPLPGKAPLQVAEPQKVEQPSGMAGEVRLKMAKERQTSLPAPTEAGRFQEAEADQLLLAHQKASGVNGVAPEQVLYVGLNDGLWEEDAPSWDVDAVLADLSQPERQALVEKLSTRR